MQFLTASGVRSQGKLQRIQDPTAGICCWIGSRHFEINMWMWRYGMTFPRQISVDQAVEFRKKRAQESRARGAETLRRRRDAAWAKGASAPQWITLGECYIVYDIDPDMLWHDLRYWTSERPSISYTISLYDIEGCLFDIEGMKPRYRQPYSWPWISKVCDLRYRVIRPTPSISTYDIEGAKRRYRISIRYRMFRSISNVRRSILGWQGSR